jgi:hypothetical protein
MTMFIFCHLCTTTFANISTLQNEHMATLQTLSRITTFWSCHVIPPNLIQASRTWNADRPNPPRDSLLPPHTPAHDLTAHYIPNPPPKPLQSPSLPTRKLTTSNLLSLLCNVQRKVSIPSLIICSIKGLMPVREMTSGAGVSARAGEAFSFGHKSDLVRDRTGARSVGEIRG